jgi:hypothetical protein
LVAFLAVEFGVLESDVFGDSYFEEVGLQIFREDVIKNVEFGFGLNKL